MKIFLDLLGRIETFRAQQQRRWQLTWIMLISTISGLLASQLFHNLLWLNAVEISWVLGISRWSLVIVLLEMAVTIWLLARVVWSVSGAVIKAASEFKEGFYRGYNRRQ